MIRKRLKKQTRGAMIAQWLQSHIYHSAAVVAVLIVIVVLKPGNHPANTRASGDDGVTVTCSSVRPNTPPCDVVKPGVRGDWLSDHEQAGAWVKYTFPHPVWVRGMTLVDRATAHNDILDGHFEFDDSKRYPDTGGIGALNDLTEPIIALPKPLFTTTVKFVVDKTTPETGDAGLALFQVWYGDPQLEEHTALTATCSSEHPGAWFHCSNVLPGVDGAWWTPEDGGKGAWVELAVPVKGTHPPQPVFIKGIKIDQYVVTDSRDNPDNLVLDGHFVLKNGMSETRLPKEGGLGELAQYRGKIIPVEPSMPVTSVRFVVDKTPDTASHIGIDEFDLVIDTTRILSAPTTQYLAVTVVAQGGSVRIDRMESVTLIEPPRPSAPTQQLYKLEALTNEDKIVDDVQFTPQFRDIITTFKDSGPEAVSVTSDTASTTLYLKSLPGIATMKLTNLITDTLEDSRDVPPELVHKILPTPSAPTPPTSSLLDTVKTLFAPQQPSQ